MDGSDPTSTVMNKLCLRNNSAIVNTTVVLFLLLAMLAEYRNSPLAGMLHARGLRFSFGNKNTLHSRAVQKCTALVSNFANLSNESIYVYS